MRAPRTGLQSGDDVAGRTARPSAEAADFAGARELEEAVHAAWTRSLPPDHPAVLNVKGNLAVTLEHFGEATRARELFEEVLAGRARTLPPNHPHLLAAQVNLAVMRRLLGDLAGAQEMVKPGGRVTRIDLGPAADVEELVGAWRSAAARLGRLGAERRSGLSASQH